MPENSLCKICERRRAKRFCPAVHGDICTICCGEQREVTLLCPLECEYLREAHRREKPLEIPPEVVANSDVVVTEEFIRSHEELLLFCTYSLVQAAYRTEGAADDDVIAALEATIQTSRTRASAFTTKAARTIR